MYTIDDLKTDPDAQITVGCIVFFLIAFPAYFNFAAGGADGSLGGGVADYQVNGEITYVLLDSGSESIADGDTWSMTYNTDAVNNADDLNIVGVRISMSYGEDETSNGFGCAPVLEILPQTRSRGQPHILISTGRLMDRTTEDLDLTKRWQHGTTNPWWEPSSRTYRGRDQSPNRFDGRRSWRPFGQSIS